VDLEFFVLCFVSR